MRPSSPWTDPQQGTNSGYVCTVCISSASYDFTDKFLFAPYVGCVVQRTRLHYPLAIHTYAHRGGASHAVLRVRPIFRPSLTLATASLPPPCFVHSYKALLPRLLLHIQYQPLLPRTTYTRPSVLCFPTVVPPHDWVYDWGIVVAHIHPFRPTQLVWPYYRHHGVASPRYSKSQQVAQPAISRLARRRSWRTFRPPCPPRGC